MNKLLQKSISARQTLTGMKSLRACQMDKKPLYVMVLTGLSNSSVLLGGAPAVGTKGKHSGSMSRYDKAEQRYTVNQRGGWTLVEHSDDQAKKKKGIVFPILLTISEFSLVAIMAWQMQTEEFRTTHRAEMKAVMVKVQEQFKVNLFALGNGAKAEKGKM